MRSSLRYRKRLICGLSGIVAVPVALSAFTVYLNRQLASGQVWVFYGFVLLFHIDSESNVPAWFSS